jgi:hypothetical protein
VVGWSTATLVCRSEDKDDGAGAEEAGADVEGILTSDVPEEAAGSEGGVVCWGAVTVWVAWFWVCTLVCTTVSV